MEKAVDVEDVEQFMKAGFSVTFVGPEGDVTSGAGASGAEGCRGEVSVGLDGGEGVAESHSVEEPTMCVDEDTFGVWAPEMVSAQTRLMFWREQLL